jgi:hypothetical protein
MLRNGLELARPLPFKKNEFEADPEGSEVPSLGLREEPDAIADGWGQGVRVVCCAKWQL